MTSVNTATVDQKEPKQQQHQIEAVAAVESGQRVEQGAIPSGQQPETTTAEVQCTSDIMVAKKQGGGALQEVKCKDVNVDNKGTSNYAQLIQDDQRSKVERKLMRNLTQMMDQDNDKLDDAKWSDKSEMSGKSEKSDSFKGLIQQDFIQDQKQQRHTSMLGNIIEGIDSHQNMLFEPAQETMELNISSDENPEEDGGDKTQAQVRKSLNRQKGKIDFDEQNNESILEQLGNLEVNELDNVVSFADNAAMKLAIETSMKVRSLGQNKNKDSAFKKQQLSEQFAKKKKILQKYIKSAPFTRLFDKMTFIFGVLLVIFTAFFLGRYPNTFYYTFHSTLVPILLISKLVYYKSMGWHYYMTDFCYFANILLFVFLNFLPKNDYLFKACFLFANGMLGVSVAAFRNQMVFHKFDNLTSLALHIFPNITIWNMRWTTMPYEATLPESERQFLEFNSSFEFSKFFTFPLAYYFAWAFMYYMVNFVIKAKKINEKKYENIYTYFHSKAWSRKLIYINGKRYTKFTFMGFHALWFILAHFFALPVIYFQSLNTFLLILWLTWSIWNGSCFYMDYFSKKYELSLQRLEQVQQELDVQQQQEHQKEKVNVQKLTG